MTIGLAINVAVLALMFGGTVWFAVCNERTFRQRVAYVNMLPGQDNFWTLIKHFDAVRYNAHLFRLFFFRDPLALYHPDLRALLTTERR